MDDPKIIPCTLVDDTKKNETLGFMIGRYLYYRDEKMRWRRIKLSMDKKADA